MQGSDEMKIFGLEYSDGISVWEGELILKDLYEAPHLPFLLEIATQEYCPGLYEYQVGPD